jgi:hypothetical protein
MAPELKWAEKVEIFAEVLRTYRRHTHPGRTVALELWRLRKNVEQMPRCAMCGEPGLCTGEWDAMGEEFSQWECPACGSSWTIREDDPYDGFCGECGQRLPLKDADYTGPVYGRCRNQMQHALDAEARC